MENLASFKTIPSAFQHVVSQSSGSNAYQAFNQATTAPQATETFTLSRKGGNFKLFTVRTSEQSVKSYTPTATYAAHIAPSGTASFMKMHKQVNQNLVQVYIPTIQAGVAFPDSTSSDYTPPSGQTDPSFASPIGDGTLCLLVIAMGYVLFCCRKKIYSWLVNRKMNNL